MMPKKGSSGISVPHGIVQDIARAINDWMNGLVVGEFLRERSEQGKNRNEAPILPNLHIENFDLQRVAGLSAFDVNRPGDEMWTWPGR